MYGNHVTRSVRGYQCTYEERALEYRRQIDFLIRERQLYQDQFQDLQPTFADDEQRLSHLDATIRNTIPELEQHITDYTEAVDKWRQLAADYEIAEHRDSNDWAQSMYVTIDTFFEQPELYPTPLDAQFAQLISDYRDLLEAVTEIRMDPVRMAGFEREATTPASTPAQETLAAVEQTTSNSSERRTVPGPLSGSARNSPEQQSDPDPLSGNDERSPAPAISHSEDRPRVTINDDVRRHFYTDQSATSYATSRLSLRTIDAYHARASTSSSQPSAATRRGVPIVQQLDFNNNTTPSSTPPRPEVPQRTEDSGTHAATGIMTYADGNVANASPISWRNPRIGTPAEITEHGTDSTAPLVAESPRETFVPRQLTPLPSSPAVPNTNRQKTKSTTDAAGGRGASSFFSSGPSRIGTSSHHPNTSLLSGQPGPTATAPTTEAHSRLEAASAFYGKATFHRDTTSTSQLVLKDLPIEPFEGNIRRYPAFRNRFLDVIEGHQQMPPRHKLQYLLQFLRGEPYQLANNFQLTDENYYAVINTLEERYGNEDVIRSLLMADLIALRAPSQTVQDLRRFHDEAFRITTDLKQLGDDVDANRLYSETLMAKLSPTVKLELIRNSTYVAEKTISSILSGLQKYTQQLEIAATTGLLWTQLSVGNSCPPPGRRTPTRPGSPHPIKSNRAPYAGYGAEAEDVPKADSRQDRKKCALCDLSHWASKCIIYRSIKKRYNRIKKLGLCFLCLRGNHWVEKCPQRTLGQCRYCDRRTPHHRALCITIASRKTQRSDPVRNYDPGTKPVPGGPSGDGQSAERHAPVKKTVNRSESRQDSTARIVPPSAQRPSGDGNLKRIHRKKRSRSTGTGPQGRNSTSRPTTASTVEDMTTKEVNACDLERRLTAVEAFLTTARCPTNRDSPPTTGRLPVPMSRQHTTRIPGGMYVEERTNPNPSPLDTASMRRPSLPMQVPRTKNGSRLTKIQPRTS
ncbi:Zinc knuckle family protein [Aphelenchoides avenae]|nr:Zinc knuckle family protein [Aphelenchus avenae]